MDGGRTARSEFWQRMRKPELVLFGPAFRAEGILGRGHRADLCGFDLIGLLLLGLVHSSSRLQP